MKKPRKRTAEHFGGELIGARLPDGTRWRYVCYRFDFGCNPERFRLLMEQKMIIALPCPTRDGDPLIHKGPIVSYRNKNGEYLCFYVGEEVMSL